MIRKAVSFSLLTVAMSGLSAVAAPVVTSFTPTIGQEGTKIQVSGSGFTGTTALRFVPMDNNPVPVSFSIIDDTHLEVIAPKYTVSGGLAMGFGLMVQAGNTATLAIADMQEVTTDVSYLGNERSYHVMPGGKVSGYGGSAIGFIEAGGTYDFGGGGTSYFFVKKGGTLDWAVGGESFVFAEVGSNILTLPPQSQLTIFDELTLSKVPSNFHYVPEPSTLLLAALAGLGLVAMRVRSQR